MKTTNLIFVLVIGVIISAIFWINITEIEQIIRANGEIEPEQQIQIVQPRFSGRIQSINVNVGDKVAANDVLAKLNSLDATSQLQENLSTIDVLVAEITRLKAETTNNAEINWGDSIPRKLVDVQEALFKVRKQNLIEKDNVLLREQQLAQSRVDELSLKIEGTKKLLALKNEEKDILEPLVIEGVEPKTRLIQLKQEVQKLENQLNSSDKNLATIKIELEKTESQRIELAQDYKTRSFEELAKKQNQLRVTRTKTDALKERLEDTILKAPIDGVITKVYPKGPGEIISAGAEVIEIAPFFDKLRVRANLEPADVTDLREGQSSRISLLSYDFTIYGTISGFISEIAQNTSENERGEIYYEIWVESRNVKFSKSSITPQILPGMLAQVEIIGKKRTIFEYLMKPVLKTTSRALTEK